MNDQNPTPNDPNPDEARFAPAAGALPDDVPSSHSEPTAKLPTTRALPTAPDDADEEPGTIPPPAPALEIDVESALGAVSNLDEMIAEQEAAEEAERRQQREAQAAVRARQRAAEALERTRQEEIERQAYAEKAKVAAAEAVIRDEEARLEDILANPMPRPQVLEMGRGSLMSILPGAALAGIGAWLTFAYTTGSAPPPTTVVALLLGLFALVLVLGWMSAGRWNRGVLFMALWGMLSAGGVYAAGTVLGVGLPALLVLALGGAVFLSGVIARPVSGGAVLFGLMLLVGGGVALADALGQMPPVVSDVIGTGWVAVAVIAGLVLILPIFRRLRG